MEYLFTEVINLDEIPNTRKFIFKEKVPYSQVYSFIRDRIRAIRVDLHVQQPMSTCSKEYVMSHEAALRFELLSMYIVKGDISQTSSKKSSMAPGATEKFDEKMALKAMSQTIEPLLNSYRHCRESQEAKNDPAASSSSDEDMPPVYTSPNEGFIRRMIILLLIQDQEQLLAQISKLSDEMIALETIGDALKVFAAYQSQDYAEFFRFYRTCLNDVAP